MRRVMKLRACDAITSEELARHGKKGLRVGIKAMFFDRSGRVLLGRLPDGYPHRFNLPGGGIDAGESAAVALVREIEEEVGGTSLHIDEVATAIIVAEGKISFPRDGWLGKYEYIVALPVEKNSIRQYSVKEGSKLILFPPMTWWNLKAMVQNATHVNRQQRILYMRALANIGTVLG